MILLGLLLIPFAGALLSYVCERIRPGSARVVALIASLLLVGVTFQAWQFMPTDASTYYLSVSQSWIPSAGISLTLKMDGLAFIMIALSALLSLISVAASWSYIKVHIGGFYFCLLWIIGGIMGVFLAQDLFLFYFFWEMMLVPMYFLIGVWGHERRVYAAVKFFLFTFISGLFLLAAILGLYVIHYRTTGVLTFDFAQLINTPLSVTQQSWILLGLFIGFAVKLPAFGVHTWLPDAHTEAPTAGSIILAGLLLKTGAYGLLRFALPLCPEAFIFAAPYIAILGLIGIVYGAVLAFAQADLKRLVAYSSVSHMGFILLALGANNTLAGQGLIMQMVCHGLSTGALFALVGMIDERYHTRSLHELGGLWNHVPRLSGFVMFFAIASIGLPGLGNFIAELLILLGSYEVWPVVAVIGALGLFFAALYSLKMIAGSIHGPWTLDVAAAADLKLREWLILLPLVILLLWLGLAPKGMLQVTEKLWNGDAAVPMANTELKP